MMTNEEKILELLAAINTRMGNMETDMAGLKTDVSDLKTNVASLETNVANLQTDVAGIRIEIENRVDPYLQTLAEGQKGILETLAPKNRVEALEEEVDFMKHIIKTLAKEVDELKKAN
jgi:predicted  nucleic acid-binding Zn-ribbon protein